MPNQSINIEFESSKYDALKFFIEKQDTTIEQELSAHLDKMYQKNVPSQVREFVERDSHSGSDQQEQTAESVQSEQTATATESASAAPRRRYNRRSEQAAPEPIEEAPAQTEQSADEQEEAQGMSMGM